MAEVLVADLSEVSVLSSREPGDFVVRHRRAGALLSGSAAAREGTLAWRLEALDRALGDLLLPTPSGGWVALALYNPYTFEVGVGRSEGCRAFSDGASLRFDVPLLSGVLSGEGLELEGRLLGPLPVSLERAYRTVPASV